MMQKAAVDDAIMAAILADLGTAIMRQFHCYISNFIHEDHQY